MTEQIPITQPEEGSLTPESHAPASATVAVARTDRRGREVRSDHPPFRRLRGYAFDPSVGRSLNDAVINLVTMKIPWEFDPLTGRDLLQPGPVGEYVEVVDVDPPTGCFYKPIDLNRPYLLAQDGLAPSEANPQFHQQMVYAVSMTTIRNFERALGRVVFWAPHQAPDEEAPGGDKYGQEEYVQRLRIYPHALREQNSFYSPVKKALLLGYFPATTQDVRQHLPGGMVFTALSHDVIAHETTHALLDSVHPRFHEASNPDVPALHEAFADIVALFQHFSFPEVVRHQIAKTHGDLHSENLLGQLAQEFGEATGMRGALRDALGGFDEDTGKWEFAVPDPTVLDQTMEPHARGAILVAALFDTFIAIYKSRTADLMRIATSGSGILPPGALHPDLVNRLAQEAAKSAQHVLNMCIRALDYCPPVDPTFGDFLRALITADYDLVHDDDLGYRLAVVEASRQRGIYPRDVRSLSVDTLLWSAPENRGQGDRIGAQIKNHYSQIQEWDVSVRSKNVWERLREARINLHQELEREGQALNSVGLDLTRPGARFEIHSVRPARRIGPDGEVRADLVVEITQSRRVYLDPAQQQKLDSGNAPDPDAGTFIFRGGCTLLIDPLTWSVRYAIRKDINSEKRLEVQRKYLGGEEDTSLHALYFGKLTKARQAEPFAFLHRRLQVG